MEVQQHQLSLDTEKLFHRLCSLYIEENPADLSLCCGPGDCIKAHRLLLSLCSPLFEKDSSLQTEKQAANNVIVLLNVKKPILLHILDLIYKGKVTVSENELADFYKTLDQLKMNNILKEKPPIVPTECQTDNDENHAKNKDEAIRPPRKTLVEILREPQTNMLNISDAPRKDNISTKKRKTAEVSREVDLESFQFNEKPTKTITNKRSRSISPQPSSSKYSEKLVLDNQDVSSYEIDSPIRKNPFARPVHKRIKTNNKNVNDDDQESNTLNHSPVELMVVNDSDGNDRASSSQDRNRTDGTDSDSTQSDIIVTHQKRPTRICSSSDESEAADRKKEYDKLLISSDFKFSNYKDFCCICNEKMRNVYSHVRDQHRRVMKKKMRCSECVILFRLAFSLKRHICKRKSINQ